MTRSARSRLKNAAVAGSLVSRSKVFQLMFDRPGISSQIFDRSVCPTCRLIRVAPVGVTRSRFVDIQGTVWNSEDVDGFFVSNQVIDPAVSVPVRSYRLF